MIEKIIKKFIRKLVPIENKKEVKKKKLTPPKNLKRSVINTQVIGIGGCGNKIIEKANERSFKNTDYLYIDNDSKLLTSSSINNKIVLGDEVPNIDEFAQNKDVLFFVGGLGGGTASKLLPYISNSIDKNTVTFGIVTKPFGFEGNVRKKIYKKYLDEINKDVDILMIVDNDKLMKMSERNTSMLEAFNIIDDFIVEFMQKTVSTINNSVYIDKENIAIKTIRKSMENPLFEIIESNNFESKITELLKKSVVEKDEDEELEIPKFLLKNE